MTAQTGHIGYLLAVWELHFIGRDYLGSITHIADSEGNLVAEYSYDAWGRLRDPDTQELYGNSGVPDLLLWRGVECRTCCCGAASPATNGCRGSGCII